MGWALPDAANFALRNTFGESVTHTPVTASPTTFVGVVDKRYIRAQIGSAEAKHSMQEIICTVRLADLNTAPLSGDTLTTADATYEIRDRRDDGHGMADLVLILVE